MTYKYPLNKLRRFFAGAALVAAAIIMPATTYAAPPSPGSVPQFSLEDPFYNNSFLKSWSHINGLSAMRFSFIDIENRLDQNRVVFTKSGYEKFTGTLEASGLLEMIESEELSLRVGMVRNPVILDQGVENGRYRWIVQMPMFITYSNLRSRFQDFMKLTMVIVRSDEPHLRDAVGIEEWVTEPMPDPYAGLHDDERGRYR
jgi:hypothetical protein